MTQQMYLSLTETRSVSNVYMTSIANSTMITFASISGDNNLNLIMGSKRIDPLGSLS